MKSIKRVLLTEPIHPDGLSILENCSLIKVVEAENIKPKTLIKAIKGVHGVIVRTAVLNKEILSAGKELEIVSRHGVGCDNLDVEYLSNRNLPVAIASGANAMSVAEHTIGLMLATAREFPAQNELVKMGKWRERGRYSAVDLHGSKVLILGFGRVGKLVASRCMAFGMDVVVADINLDYEKVSSIGCKGVSDFRQELPGVDFLTLHVPLDSSTRHIIGKRELLRMKKGSILINCARGGVVDETALLASLISGQIRMAGLDVMAVEPPDSNNPLLSRDDVLLTPHTGAGARSAIIAMAKMSAQNIVDAFFGNLRSSFVFNYHQLDQSALRTKILI